MLRDSTVAAVVRTRPQAIPLSMITMRKSIHGFLFLYGYGAPLGGCSGRRSSAIILFRFFSFFVCLVHLYDYLKYCVKQIFQKRKSNC